MDKLLSAAKNFVMKDELLTQLSEFGQQHLLAFWDQLGDTQRAKLAQQIEGLKLQQIAEMFEQSGAEENLVELARRAEPPAAVRIGDGPSLDAEKEAERTGETALADGKVGVVLVAGGQGSRLGFDHPKGMFPIGPLSGASLFDILFGKIDAVSRCYGSKIPLYLMTSPATHQETLDCLATSGQFGLPATEVTIFCQGTFPAVDAASGKLLLGAHDSLFLSPDGHGGMLAALDHSGALENMKQRGLKHLFYFQVDNPLATVCDPSLIGYHVLAKSEYTLQVVAKQDPEDKVGNVVQVDGGTRIIEYSDLPEDVGRLRNQDGSLKLWAGSIAVHVFDVDFLIRMATAGNALPIHRAKKKVPFINASGDLVNSDAPNAIKYEQFIFDLLPHAVRTLSVEVDPSDAFAPLKNASGADADTAEHVQQQMMALHRRMLNEAGINVDESIRVEINPRFAFTVGQLGEKLSSGTTIDKDTYFE